MSEYRTLYKNSDEFLPHLDGSFSADKLALPVKTFNIGQTGERVTFEIVDRQKLAVPNSFYIWAKACRAELLSLTMTPILFVIFAGLLSGLEIQLGFALAAVASVFFLHGALFMLNDYYDHLQGTDRSDHSSGNEVINKGWVTPKELQWRGYFLLAAGSLCGLPVVIEQPVFLALSAFVALLGVAGYSVGRSSLKSIGLGEMAAFWCLGPFLTYGISRAAFYRHDLEVLYYGILFGAVAALSLQVRQWRNIVADDQVGQQTLSVRLGFDGTKKLIFFGLVLLNLYFLAGFYFHANLIGVALGFLVLNSASIYFWRQIRQVTSPLSSRLPQLVKLFPAMQLIVAFSLLILLTFQ